MILAGLAQVDITPLLGVEIAGSLYKKYVQRIADPLGANILVMQSNHTCIGLVSLDLLSVPWKVVDTIRTRAIPLGIPKDNLLVCATHNHAGAAIANLGQTTRDENYLAALYDHVESGIKQAVAGLQPVKIAIASTLEHRVTFIRRVIMKDGSVKCQRPYSNAIRCRESVLDPEVGILAIKDLHDHPLGLAVNFACHTPDYNKDGVISAGWPGALYRGLKEAYGPQCISLLLNGALGDVYHKDELDPTYQDTVEKIGVTLAGDVIKCFPTMEFMDTLSLRAVTTTVHLPLRDLDGPWGIHQPFPQPLADAQVYGAMIARLRARRACQPFAHAQVQCLRLGDNAACVTLPAEAFAALGLNIKMHSPIPYTFVVGAANGMVGYIPTREAFNRGGYETTLSLLSKCVPEAGDMLVEAATQLLTRM